ncbi:MAG TPA: enoyl-CoA hydratase-related protein, partial [Bdellovibrionota bacterium]|nr:enoyl-CoA hydratase-related protein [Bdellovibrionota bacterium]
SGDQVFCAGADLKAAAGRQGPADGSYRELLLELRRCRKPTVALARGHVLAGGMGLVLACDLAVACDDVHFSTPEIGVGMFPMMVFGLLSRSVSRRRAFEMAFLGEKVPAPQACQDGIVNHVYPRAAFDARSRELVAKLAAKSGAILTIGKEAILECEDLPLDESLALLERALERVMRSQDSREGIAAFIEKRKPEWSHR